MSTFCSKSTSFSITKFLRVIFSYEDQDDLDVSIS